MINNLTVWIPSRNRACQLHAILESINLNWKNIPHIQVVYEYSNDSFKLGYDLLAEMWPDVQWHHGFDLYKDFLISLKNSTKYFCGCTDDCLFYREVDITDEDLDFVFDEKVLTLSFRLGKNSIVQDYTDGRRQPELKYVNKGKFIEWEYKRYDDVTNWGYPFAIDGHVYIAKELERYTLNFAKHVNKMRDWEGTVNGGHNRSSIHQTHIASLENSVLFSNPVNCVQVPALFHSSRVFIPPDELNDLFLTGRVIDVAKAKELSINGAHFEWKYAFRNL